MSRASSPESVGFVHTPEPSESCGIAAQPCWLREGEKIRVTGFGRTLPTLVRVGIDTGGTHQTGVHMHHVVAMNYVAQAFVALDGEIVIEIVGTMRA